jgi:hypothetical protein
MSVERLGELVFVETTGARGGGEQFVMMFGHSFGGSDLCDAVRGRVVHTGYHRVRSTCRLYRTSMGPFTHKVLWVSSDDSV